MPLESKLHLNDETIQKLQELIQVNIDSEEGLSLAAQRVDSPHISSVFSEIGQSRLNNVRELQSYVTVNHEKPQKSGSVAGAAHRGWTAMRSAINDGDAYVMLIEAERGEAYIKNSYVEVLKKTAGSAVNDVLQRQYASIKKGHDQIRSLRDGLKKS